MQFAGSTPFLPQDCRTKGCGKGAECTKEKNHFICHCPSGTTGNAEVECRTGRICQLFEISKVNFTASQNYVNIISYFILQIQLKKH